MIGLIDFALIEIVIFMLYIERVRLKWDEIWVKLLGKCHIYGFVVCDN